MIQEEICEEQIKCCSFDEGAKVTLRVLLNFFWLIFLS